MKSRIPHPAKANAQAASLESDNRQHLSRLNDQRPLAVRQLQQQAAMAKSPQVVQAQKLRQLMARSADDPVIQGYDLNADKAESMTKRDDEDKVAFRLRMAAEMKNLRDIMEEKDEDPLSMAATDLAEIPASLLAPQKAASDEELEPGVFDEEKRSKIDLSMSDRELPTPKVGISNRGARGFINDTRVFENSNFAFAQESLPPNFKPLQWGDEKSVMDKQLEGIRGARSPGNAKHHIKNVSGIFIPGGQDREKDGSPEKTSREKYEMALIKAARNRGMPMMAVCGGSRSLARGYGAKEQSLSKAVAKIHKKSGQAEMAHPINLRDPNLPKIDESVREDEHTIVGGAAPKGAPGISMVNSTHEKSIAHVEGQIEPVNRLPGTGERELMTTAWSPALKDKGPETAFPEAFETRYGAPVVGLTSHPEAMHSDEETRAKTPEDAQIWSDNLFHGFAQSMQAYDAKQAVNAELLGPIEMARRAKPSTFAKWYGKRNWQKLLQLGMISEDEAEDIKAEVKASKDAKYQRLLNGTRFDI